MTELTASLPMYNLPEMAFRNAAFWKALSEEVSREHVPDVPTELSFSRPAVPEAIGREVLFSQTCGYPLQTIYRGQFALLGVPTYDFPGCGAAHGRAVGQPELVTPVELIRLARCNAAVAFRGQAAGDHRASTRSHRPQPLPYWIGESREISRSPNLGTLRIRHLQTGA